MILSKEWVDEQRAIPVPWTMLGESTFWRTYSRNKWDQGCKETFVDVIERVVNGTFDILKIHARENDRPWNFARAEDSAKEMFILMKEFKWSPPGRGLFSMGTSSVTKNGGAVLNNCGFLSSTDPSPDMFAMFLDLLMLGVGVGFDTRGTGQYTVYSLDNRESSRMHVVEDTRQGWVKAVELQMRSMYEKDLPALVFDYSAIREPGIPLKTFGGVSSGSYPLKRLLEDLHDISVVYNGKTISSTFIGDVGNLIGRCAVSGNIRRSAELLLGFPDDHDFLQLKTDLEKVMQYRGMSNNSVLAHVGMNYKDPVAITAAGYDMGYVWLDNARMFGRMNGSISFRTDFRAMGCNPCIEQTLEDKELCCLVETYPSNHATLNEYLRTLKYAYLYAKAVTLVKTGYKVTDSIIERNRRIGCSMSGVIPAIRRHGGSEFIRWCERGYDYLTGLDSAYSSWLGVSESIKRTSIKPSGTVSLLANVSPGIHYPHSEYYLRRVRYSSNSPLLPVLEQAGYKIQPDVYAQTGNADTMVVDFPVKEEFFEKGKKSASMWEQLALAALMQRHWADNQVSVTVHFTPEEAKDIELALEMYQHQLKAVSFLPYNPHETYKLAPYEEITEQEYGDKTEYLKDVDLPYDMLDVKQTSIAGCDGDNCAI